MMNSFDQLLELVHEARDEYKKFVDTGFDLTIEQAFMNYYKSREICKDIQKRLGEVKMREDGSGYGYDNCVYYMAKEWLHKYEHSALIVFTSKLGEMLSEMAEQNAEEKQRETLKSLIKEAIKEVRENQNKTPAKRKSGNIITHSKKSR